VVPRWATSSVAQLVQPPTGDAADGFDVEEEPPAQWFNWLLHNYGRWIDFLRGAHVEHWTRVAWGTSPARFNSTSLLRLAVDTATVDSVGAAYRYVVAGVEPDGTAALRVSQRGNEWEARRNLPAGAGAPTALGVAGSNWLVGLDDGTIHYGAVDDGTTAGPVASAAVGWSTASVPGSPTQVQAFACNPVGGRVFALTTAGGLYSDNSGATWTAFTESGTARSGNGLDAVYTGSLWALISQSGQVYASSDGATFVYKATVAVWSGEWRIAADAAGKLVAWRAEQSSALDLYTSTDGGVTWTAVTPAGATLAYLTGLRFADGTWMATSSRAPWLLVSNDLVSWRALRPPVSATGPASLRALAWDGGAWVAAGNGFVLHCPRGSDPTPGDLVVDDSPGTLTDAASLRGRLISTTAPTNGQVYAWNSSTLRWTAVTPSSGGTTSPLTTNGDLWFYSTTDARLPIGTTAQVLTVASGLPAWRSLPWATHTSTGVQTTDATQTTCGSYTTSSNSAVTIKLLVTALKSDFSASSGWELTVTARNAGGTVTLEGGGAIIVGPTDTGTAWSVTVDVSGADVRLRVTGAAATTVDWTARWIVG